MSPVSGVEVMLCVLDYGEEAKQSTVEGSGCYQRHVPPGCRPRGPGCGGVLLSYEDWTRHPTCRLLLGAVRTADVSLWSGLDKCAVSAPDTECEYPPMSVGVVLILRDPVREAPTDAML